MDLTRVAKKLWSVSVTVIPGGIGAISTTPKSLKRRVEKNGSQRKKEHC